MSVLLKILLETVGLILLIPVSVLFVEVLLAVTQRRGTVHARGERRPVAVLMPAHNESLIIADTVRAVVAQLGKGDRLLVIADNCGDETAAIARAQNAQVIERTDVARRGKGYALDFGVRHLELDPPEIVLILDADCRLAPGALDTLARRCALTGRPLQALYLMHAAKDARLKMRIAQFAWVVKNEVRPMGLDRLGLPCQLMGTGMAFPWRCIKHAQLATGHIVEDLKLGIELARAGVPPIFCCDALVTSEFPVSIEGIEGQRTRWEHGHLGVIMSEVPRLFLCAIERRSPALMAMALDLSVPPLALLALLVTASWFASAVFCIFTRLAHPLGLATLSAVLFLLAIFLAWLRAGRQIISLGSLALAIVYVLWKIPLYAKFLVARQMDWVRSKRDED